MKDNENGVIGIDAKRVDKAMMCMFSAEEELKPFSDDLKMVLEKHGVTDFYLMGFKHKELSASGLNHTTGFNIVSLSNKITPMHVAKKNLEFIGGVPDDNQKVLIEILKECLNELSK